MLKQSWSCVKSCGFHRPVPGLKCGFPESQRDSRRSSKSEYQVESLRESARILANMTILRPEIATHPWAANREVAKLRSRARWQFLCASQATPTSTNTLRNSTKLSLREGDSTYLAAVTGVMSYTRGWGLSRHFWALAVNGSSSLCRSFDRSIASIILMGVERNVVTPVFCYLKIRFRVIATGSRSGRG
jgi:hypothetical protein